jgi:hypothetical protein
VQGDCARVCRRVRSKREERDLLSSVEEKCDGKRDMMERNYKNRRSEFK